MPRPKALIFDMDGLLLDTEGLYKRSWTQAAREMGFDLSDSLYLKLIGITVADAECVLENAFGPGFSKEKFHLRAKALYEDLHIKEGHPLKPGVRELLVWAKDAKIVCVVGTSTVRDEALRRLKHHDIAEFFADVIGGDMVENGKPHPETFLKAQNAVNIPPQDCLVLEDAHTGLLAAKAGGMRSCLVPDLLPASAESRELAEAVFESLHEVCSWLQNDCPSEKKEKQVQKN